MQKSFYGIQPYNFSKVLIKSKTGLVIFFFVVLVTSFSSMSIPSAYAQSACPESFVGLSRPELESALAVCEKEEAILQQEIGQKGREKASLNRDISLLNTKIKQAKLSIRASTASINNLVEDIGVKKKIIGKYSDKITRERESLAQLIRKTEEIDSITLTEVAVSDKKLSELFGDADSFEYVMDAIDRSITEIDVAKNATEVEKLALEVKKTKESDLRYAQELEKKKIEANEVEKQRLLKVTKGQEAAYQKDLAVRQKRAAAIRATLFSLRDTGEIPFGKAFDYANAVSKATGIRPAFLLAIFQQESGFGKSQGSCYLKDAVTGSGVGKNTGTVFQDVMHPGRDVKPFLGLMDRLGRDPYTTPVSCPQQAGYGGAMGAAQFIPSTWMLFEDRIAKALGISMPDPWNARDAFTASGIYLTDLGARPTSYNSERDAACRYFSGKKCSQSSWATTYGNQVMKRAEVIQVTMIDPLAV
ncbi:MAG: lytic murein transglycosylase [Patescibacteria group bacterium]